VQIASKFKLLNQDNSSAETLDFSDGIICSLSGGGIQLEGAIKNHAIIPNLVMHKIVVGVNFNLPETEQQIAAICRVSWVNSAGNSQGKKGQARLGLEFREISSRDRDRIFDYIIHHLLK
jgi:c-di-GMP-binding flagellar brake protein YcgR